ncbi:MAG: PqqD family peptide modification chaperone [Bacteroidia bacterium]|nr:PqqD family peptide modification chaperone [Bacteroidia bacterium]
MNYSDGDLVAAKYLLRQEIESIETMFHEERRFLFSNRKTGLIYELPETGFWIVNQILNGISPIDIAEIIIEEYDVDVNVITNDIKELLTELIELQFIKEIND